MAETTMEAIKKKMQAMRLEKESAFDRADHLEHRLLEQRYIYDKVHSDCHRHRRRGSTVVISHQIGPNAAASIATTLIRHCSGPGWATIAQKLKGARRGVLRHSRVQGPSPSRGSRR